MIILWIALENAEAPATGAVVPGVSSGVSLSTGLMHADLGHVEDIGGCWWIGQRLGSLVGIPDVSRSV